MKNKNPIKFLIFGFVNIFRYINIGFFITLYVLIDLIVSTIYYFFLLLVYAFVFSSFLVYRLIKYIFMGFVVLSRIYYRFIRYVFIGFSFPFVITFRGIIKLNDINEKMRAKQELEKKRKEAARERNRKIKEENERRLKELKQQDKDSAKEEKKSKQDEKNGKTEIYINENIKIEKKKIADYINDFLSIFTVIPNKIKNSFTNNNLKKNEEKQKEITRQALLLDFDGEDAKKSSEKIMYKYVAKDPEGKLIKGYFPAFSKVEVHSFLLSEGNEVYSIETNKLIQSLYGNGNKENKKKIKTRDLIFFCTQLSTYLKAGITLVESLKILSHQFKNKYLLRIFRTMVYDLSMGDNFSTAMEKEGEAFPRLFINMAKTSEMTGELPEVLDDMADYFTETDKTKKQMVTAMTYPLIVLVLALAAIIFIMVYVVPQFAKVYEGLDGVPLPGITVFVLNMSDFLKHNFLYIIIGICSFVLAFVYLFKNVKIFKTFVQWTLMHLPIFGNVIIYNEVTMFSKTFSSLLAHNVFITDSMEILNKITNNEIYKMLILDTITNLAKGEKISLAFKNHWAFPVPAYEMITTGERTGQLPEMMAKVSAYYQDLHRNSVTRIKTFIEPALIIFLTFMVGGVVLSIVIPMFSFYGSINMG